MGDFFKCISIFETTLVKTAPSKIIIDPAKVEFFSGSRSFKVPVQVGAIISKGTDSLIARSVTLRLLNTAKYLSITVRTKESHPDTARKCCEDIIDRIVTSLFLRYGMGLFSKQIYRGWLLEEKKGILEAWIRVGKPFDIHESEINSFLKAINKKLDSDFVLRTRYETMAHFFSMAILVPPSEEKFLYLWTILEIFPMENTTNIKPISQFLAQHVGKDAKIVKEKLGIGKIFKIRSDLVHNGYLNVPISEKGEFFEKLEKICVEVLRGLSGLDYNNSLDEYF